MLYNFGIEGESYEMIDGYPTYTENITNNSEGQSMANMLALYVRSYNEGPFIQDRRYMEQYAGLPQQQAAWDEWSISDGISRNEPYMYYAEEESTEIVKKATAIDTYANEMVSKYIMGVESFDNYDKFIAELKNRGMDEVLSAKQAAYNRYLER
jgi:putative aldouronate transport system substrate-binding protein